MSQRTPPASPPSPASASGLATRCSMKATWRQVSAPRPSVLSYDMPVNCRPSSGTWFHSLQATSQALHPMHTDVSVKKPTRGGGSPYPLDAAGSSDPSSRANRSLATAHLRPGRFGDAGPPDVLLDQSRAGRSTRPATGPNITAQGFHLLDVHVGVQSDRRQLVGGVTHRITVRPPMEREADLLNGPAVHDQRPDALGDQDPGLDNVAGRHDGGPTEVLEPSFLRQLGRDFAEHLRLQLGEIR